MNEGPKQDSNGAKEAQDVATMLEVYRVMLEEWHRAQAARADVTNPYYTALLVLLGAEAYVALVSSFTNWISVLAVVGISIFGLLLQRALASVETLNNGLPSEVGVACLKLEMKLEHASIFEGPITRFAEGLVSRAVAMPAMALELSRLFQAAFITIPTAFALITMLMAIPLTHPYIHPLLPN